MTRGEALAWQARWRLVAEATDREVRRQSTADRLRALTDLMAFAGSAGLGRPGRPEADEARVRERYRALRARLVVRGRDAR